jgi:hypothetical protein
MSSKFPELNRGEFEAFIAKFTIPGSVKFRNNKWIGLNLKGQPFTVHVKHGKTKKYSPELVETVAKDLAVSLKQFKEWHNKA